jgi:hypothetical protein
MLCRLGAAQWENTLFQQVIRIDYKLPVSTWSEKPDIETFRAI